MVGSLGSRLGLCSGLAGSTIAARGSVSDAGVDGVGHGAEGGGEIGVADGVENGFGLFFAREHACTGEEGEVAADDGKID